MTTKLEKKLKEKLRLEKSKAKASAKKFNNEIKKAISTAIVAAFGFIIALAWRDVITEYIDKITTISPISGKLISALIITILGVIGIFLVTKILKVKE